LYKQFCQQDTAKTFTDLSQGRPVSLLLPLILTENCNQEYDAGEYTLHVKACLPNTTIHATHPIQLQEPAPSCTTPQHEQIVDDITTAAVDSASAGESAAEDEAADNTTESEPGQEPFAITAVTVPDRVAATEPFPVTVTVNTGEERIADVYGYAYNGSNPVTLGKENEEWKNTWTAATQTVTLHGQTTTRFTVRTEDVSGTFPFTVKVKTPDKTLERTTTLAVRPSHTLNTSYATTGDTLRINTSTDCDSCTVLIQTPSKTVSHTPGAPINLLHESGRYTATLQRNGEKMDATGFTVNTTADTATPEEPVNLLEDETASEKEQTDSLTGAFFADTPVPSIIDSVVGFVSSLF
jgi:hypothetical protein